MRLRLVVLLALSIPSLALGADHPRNLTIASSCALGCGSGIPWSNASAIDGNPHVAWSSTLHMSATSGPEWLAYYWDTNRLTDHLHIQGRIFEGKPMHLPPHPSPVLCVGRRLGILKIGISADGCLTPRAAN